MSKPLQEPNDFEQSVLARPPRFREQSVMPDQVLLVDLDVDRFDLPSQALQREPVDASQQPQVHTTPRPQRSAAMWSLPR